MATPQAGQQLFRKKKTWLDCFFVPKACDDVWKAMEATMSLSDGQLAQRINIVGMNYLDNYLYVFTNDGDFIEYEVDYDKKKIVL